MQNTPPRIFSDPERGLTAEQVRQQQAKGLTNGDADVKTKSIGRIVRDNVMTPFNLLNAILAALDI